MSDLPLLERRGGAGGVGMSLYRDLSVRVAVDNQVVVHVLVDVVELVFLNVHVVVVLEVQEHLVVELDLLVMVLKVLVL